MPLAGSPGFRVLPAPPRLSADLLAGYRGLASSSVADAMGRFGFMDPGMRPRSGRALCGLAVTVQCRPADNLMVHKALQVATMGDVVVVSTCGNTTSAVFGELMCNTAAAAKLGGIVVDGAIRDVEGITRLGMAAFSRSVCPGSCDKHGPGEINVPISCGGTGVGDADGIAVVPRERSAAILELVGQLMDREKKRIAEIAAGQLFKAEIHDSLRKKGVIE